MIQEGRYKIDFGADLHGVGGIVLLRDGQISGHDTDDQYRYEGEYKYVESSGFLIAEIKVSANRPDAKSVFGTSAGEFSLSLTGRLSQDGFVLGGNSPFGGKAIQIVGRFLPTIGLGRL
ncbi:GrlR family regulatory protein [Burkholderia gladioli]|uniref:GrlR family regulatory protein n=1 Tax=Burkholderia gladioli TaxID=28095 RepID=UPI00163F54D9|nr:GrlR family regulatory protein [Burkholderia gladioli]